MYATPYLMTCGEDSSDPAPPDGQDGTARRRRQLRFRAWHRGTREADLVLGPFADSFLPGCTEAELDDFARLLMAEDPDLWDWVTGQDSPPLPHRTSTLESLQRFITARGGCAG